LRNVARENNPNTVDCPLCAREYVIPIGPIGVKGFQEDRLRNDLLEIKTISEVDCTFPIETNF
jgi:hypothetical protein